MSGPLQGFYLYVFLTITLLILTSATWFGFYIAKRITRPVQMVAEGARAIGAGQLDLRLEPETSDELGSLVESFNTMAAELGTSQERLEQSRQALAAKNVEIDARRRYIETVLERIATGVVSLDAAGNISTINGAAMRLLGLDARVVGQPGASVLAREDLRALLPLATPGASQPSGIEEITIARPEGEVHLAAASTALVNAAGTHEGAVLVLDDVTPLIRAQKVAAWRDFGAGWLLVREAGGVFTDIKGNAIELTILGLNKSTSLLASGNKALHEKAIRLLQKPSVS